MKTSIKFILDRSQSMDQIKQATIDGFNQFIMDQREQNGEASLSLLQFDTKYEVNYTDVDIQVVELLSERTFIPRHWTALTDAIAITVLDAVEEYLDKDPQDRPDKVIIIAQTDGQENSSKLYIAEQVRSMIEHTREAWGWEYMFLGASSHAAAVAKSYGIGEEGAVSYTASDDGVTTMFATVSQRVSDFRAQENC
jgi:hypothetical protein